MLTVVAGKGPFQPGQSVMHSADPRVKVLSCLLLVILIFAAADWGQLAVPGTALVLAVWLSAPRFGSIWRLCWMLRWFLLLTLLMHLLLTPGRTLLGTTWLSLDGLLTGIFVCLQMLMAVISSAILAISTPTENLAKAFGWFVKPFQWLGCPTGEWQKLLLLTMDFLPVIQEEMLAARGEDDERINPSSSPDQQGRWHRWLQKLNGLLMRLVERGDAIAHRLAGDEDTDKRPANLLPLFPMALVDQVFAGSMMAIIFCYLLLG